MKRLLTAILIFIFAISLVSCKDDELSEYFTDYKYAQIVLPSGELIEGEVEHWIGGTSSISVKINGRWYTTSYINVVLYT